MNQSNVGLEKESTPSLSGIKKLLYIGSKASIPWHVLMGFIVSGPLISGTMLVEEFVHNYENAAKVTYKVEPSGLKETISYECGDVDTLSEYICRKVTTLSDVKAQDINISLNVPGRIPEIEKFMAEYGEKFSATIRHQVGVVGLHETGDLQGARVLGITENNSSVQKKAIEIADEVEQLIPALRRQVGAEGVQNTFSDEDIAYLKRLFIQFGHTEELNRDNIQSTLYSMLKNSGFALLSPEEQKNIVQLSSKYYGNTKISLHGEKILGTFKYTDLVNGELMILCLSLLCFLSYGGLVVPLVGAKKMEKYLEKEESECIKNNKITEQQKQKFNQYRQALGSQSYEDFLRFFQSIRSIPSGKIIYRKGLPDGFVYGRDLAGMWRSIVRIDGQYIYYRWVSVDNIAFAHLLEDIGFTEDTIEITDAEVKNKLAE